MERSILQLPWSPWWHDGLWREVSFRSYLSSSTWRVQESYLRQRDLGPSWISIGMDVKDGVRLLYHTQLGGGGASLRKWEKFMNKSEHRTLRMCTSQPALFGFPSIAKPGSWTLSLSLILVSLIPQHSQTSHLLVCIIGPHCPPGLALLPMVAQWYLVLSRTCQVNSSFFFQVSKEEPLFSTWVLLHVSMYLLPACLVTVEFLFMLCHRLLLRTRNSDVMDLVSITYRFRQWRVLNEHVWARHTHTKVHWRTY